MRERFALQVEFGIVQERRTAMVRSRHLLISVLSLILFVAGGFLLLRAISFRPPVDVVIPLAGDQGTAEASDPEAPVLRVAVSAMISPRDTFESYAGFVDYIATHLDMRSELVVRKTYEEVNQLIIDDEVDLAFICTGAYVLTDYRDQMRVIVAPVVRGDEYYYSDIIVPIDSPVRSLAELQGKSFAYVDELSNTGRGAPRRLLESRGIDPDTFFAETLMTGSHDKSVRVVGSGLVEGAAIDHLIRDAMLLEEDELALRTRCVERIGPFGMPPVVVPTTLDERLAQRLQAVFLEAHEDPEAREFLDKLGIDRFRVPSPAEYDAVTDIESIRSAIVNERR